MPIPSYLRGRVDQIALINLYVPSGHNPSTPDDNLVAIVSSLDRLARHLMGLDVITAFANGGKLPWMCLPYSTEPTCQATRERLSFSTIPPVPKSGKRPFAPKSASPIRKDTWFSNRGKPLLHFSDVIIRFSGPTMAQHLTGNGPISYTLVFSLAFPSGASHPATHPPAALLLDWGTSRRRARPAMALGAVALERRQGGV